MTPYADYEHRSWGGMLNRVPRPAAKAPLLRAAAQEAKVPGLPAVKPDKGARAVTLFIMVLSVVLILGAAFLLFVDTLARVAGRTELPLGILTAVLGTPLFLWLLVRLRRSGGA